MSPRLHPFHNKRFVGQKHERDNQVELNYEIILMN